MFTRVLFKCVIIILSNKRIFSIKLAHAHLPCKKYLLSTKLPHAHFHYDCNIFAKCSKDPRKDVRGVDFTKYALSVIKKQLI